MCDIMCKGLTKLELDKRFKEWQKSQIIYDKQKENDNNENTKIFQLDTR